MKFFTHIFVIFALVSATVSPACQFMSGQSLMEICGSFVSAKKVIAVEPALADYFASKDSEVPPQELPQTSLANCAFCFAQAHFYKALTVIISATPYFNYVKLNMGWKTDFFVPDVSSEKAYPRGPPINLV